jgi:hypothetical protein
VCTVKNGAKNPSIETASASTRVPDRDSMNSLKDQVAPGLSLLGSTDVEIRSDDMIRPKGPAPLPGAGPTLL